MSSEYRETGFEVDDDTDIGGSIQDYEEAVEEAAKLDGMLADLQVNGYVAVHYGDGYLASLMKFMMIQIHAKFGQCNNCQHISKSFQGPEFFFLKNSIF